MSNGSYQNVEIRISNHKTDINTWAFRQYRGQSPSTRISIVFRDNNYAGNVLLHKPVRRQISVTEYVYDLTDGSTLSDKEIAMLTKAIRAAASGSFVDPLGMATESDVVGKYVTQNTTTTNNGDTVPSTKWNHGMDSSIEESKTNKNMKKNVVKLNENTLRKIVAESVKKILKEQRDCESARRSSPWMASPPTASRDFGDISSVWFSAHTISLARITFRGILTRRCTAIIHEKRTNPPALLICFKVIRYRILLRY